MSEGAQLLPVAVARPSPPRSTSVLAARLRRESPGMKRPANGCPRRLVHLVHPLPMLPAETTMREGAQLLPTTRQVHLVHRSRAYSSRSPVKLIAERRIVFLAAACPVAALAAEDGTRQTVVRCAYMMEPPTKLSRNRCDVSASVRPAAPLLRSSFLLRSARFWTSCATLTRSVLPLATATMTDHCTSSTCPKN